MRAQGGNRPPVIATTMPFPEQADVKESRLDDALLRAWSAAPAPFVSTRWRRRLERFVARVEDQAKPIGALSDTALREAADRLRQRGARQALANRDMVEAFAVVREAADRNCGLRHYPVQLMGGAAMTQGALAEMRTGEGKTLTALLPAVVGALSGRPVHVVTVNDYLARRDSIELAPVYAALGLTVGLVEQGQAFEQRRRAYACDVTYCTNKELVFDYLRDRLAIGRRRSRANFLMDNAFAPALAGGAGRLALRGLHVAIVDEADSVLIDEARTPLILSGVPRGGDGDSVDVYDRALAIAGQLVRSEHFEVLPNERSVRMTDSGLHRAKELSDGLAGIWRIRRAREEIVRQALAALHVFRRDVQYIVADDRVQIVDEYTGRVMPDRSWEHGMHQLIEAKEGCTISARRQTLEKLTYPQFFRHYHHLCGMTGTALEVAGELRAVYGLRVVQIPTNRPQRLTDRGARVFVESGKKWLAVAEAARTAVESGQAVLIGTRSVEASECVSAILRTSGLDHVVLNARQDQGEAEIIARAGQQGRITVATNMAGRGTDIGLTAEVRAAGGLHVILTEYHDSTRIDRQLFGRAARQGDPGSCQSIVALDDDVFVGYGARLLLGCARALVSNGGEVPAAVGWMLRATAQASAERAHSRARRATLMDGRRLARGLGFAGRP